jgi:hypothetical protein
LTVNPRLLAGGFVPIDPTSTYTVVANDYIARGRDGYLTFGAMAFEDTYILYRQARAAREPPTLMRAASPHASSQPTAGWACALTCSFGPVRRA